jgi:hypothetical protein
MALWTRVALRRGGQSKVWHAAAGEVNAHGQGRRGVCWCTPLVLLPPPRGETDAHNSPPILCYDALPCAFGAVA